MLTLRKPYLIFLGDVQTPVEAKTALGVVDWCPDDVIGELRLSDCRVTAG